MAVTSFGKRLLCEVGLTDLLWSLRPTGLYCFNFHRIGNRHDTEFDPCVFSCDSEHLEHYLRFINKHFEMIDIPELHGMIRQGKPLKKRYALITFDDGYRDNYEFAYPILKSLNMRAAFFISTSLIGSATLPWWDEIAWYVKKCAGKNVKLPGYDEPVQIPATITPDTIKSVLQSVKQNFDSLESLLANLHELAGGDTPSYHSKSELFMNWQQLQELVDAGMTIGAHSHSHRILSYLSNQELDFELSHSKALLESKLGIDANTLSYPVGGAHTYNEIVSRKARELGYESAFSFSSKINHNIFENCMELGRFSIDRSFDRTFFKKMCLTSG
ncbi:polysaccharide deacetylase family protein [Alteromonas halophila]|uniref:NodB homology domain-containing protein n=1 Tax=Alteromonas halophila TaxID=516698 RepID=A0A918JL66_9ALTE|nr:polysaccharide deacetylase family protein [Alteromonas halophila]GGW87048.1 hypothetical protein GCM10007391_21080 [Alteromonas halophila]